MPDFAEMSDEEVHKQWQATRMRFTTLSPGVEPTLYTADMAARHEEAEAELSRRGYVEKAPAWWVGPDNQTF